MAIQVVIQKSSSLTAHLQFLASEEVEIVADVRGVASATEPVLLCLEAPGLSRIGEILERLKTPTPVVLTHLTPDAVRQRWSVRDRLDVVWTCEPPWRLRDALGLPRSHELADELSGLLLHSAPNSGIIEKAIRILTTSRPPMGSFKDLARRVGVAPSTLRHHWHTVFDPTPKEVMDWLQLLRAVQLPGRRFRAAEIGCHPRTLERLALRLTGDSLMQLRGHPDRIRSTLERGLVASIKRAGLPRHIV